MRMLSSADLLGQQSDRVALKDDKLVYRACSMAFAQSLGFESPEDIIGHTDFDLLSPAIAREQMALDSQAIYSAQADISAITIGPQQTQAMIVRTPIITANGTVNGIDLRLIGGPSVNPPKSAVTIDYQTLVNDGIQGSLIFNKNDILFANDNAASVLGYPNAQILADQGELRELFADSELARLASVAADGFEFPDSVQSQRITVSGNTRTGKPLRLIARATHVQWGVTRATLLSFIDVSLPASHSPQLAVSGGESNSTEVVNVPLEVQELRDSEQRYRHFATASADFFWELDAHLMFRFVTDDLEKVLGIPREHLIGRTHQQLLEHPSNINDDEHWQQHLALLADHLPFRDFEFRWVCGGENKVIRYSGIPVFNRDKEFVGYRGTGCDVTASVKQAEATAYYANHDALTGLVNRRQFESLVDQALKAAKTDRKSHAMCFMDLDSFKIVNDTCGHEAGDELLRQLAQLFDSLVRKSDVLARLGGDEFGVFLYKCSVAEALKLANQIRAEVENFQFLWRENRFTVGVSVGLVVVDDRWESLKSLFSAADSACYIAKNQGRNRVIVYREGEGNASNRNVATHWVEEINTALEDNRVHIAYQKILPLHNQPDGLRFEMLLRLKDADGKMINPQSFLPSAERYGLATALDVRALDLTLDWLQSNPKLMHSLRYCSLNLSGATFANIENAELYVAKIKESGIAPAKLCFELTETATIANLSSASEFMNTLSELGCRFSIDDFGSGLSSFAYLRKLPIDFLKIDGLLVKNILNDPTDFTLVKSINEMSKSMGKRTIAEFVETPRLLNAVRDLGIDFAQGFHVGEPELIQPTRSTINA
jgi:diguanylate cyclase (GGDEF)-like protein/PAS domain S-box-containing protein